MLSTLTDRNKEQIKFNTEIVKLIVVLMIATGGGAISLILEGFSHGARDVILAVGGMIIAITCLIITYKRYRITQHLIDRL